MLMCLLLIQFIVATYRLLPDNRKQHIIFVTPAYPPFVGGGERYIRSLGQAIKAAGHHLTVVTSTALSEQDFWSHNAHLPETVQTEDDDGVTVIRCPLRPLSGGSAILMGIRKSMGALSYLPATKPILQKLARFFPQLPEMPPILSETMASADLVHGFNLSWEGPLMAAWQMARQQKRPFVVTPFAHLGDKHGGRAAINSTMPHQLEMLSSAEAVLTLTNVSKEGLIRYGVPANKLTTIGGGLDPIPETWPAEAELRQKFGLSGRYVLFVGRATADKGVFTAAEAVLLANQQGHELTLAVAGRVTDDFTRFYERLSLDEQTRIRPLGAVSEADKHGLLDACELLLLPSRADSFGIVLLEAWAHRKAVIGARAGGIPGVIDENITGLLIPFGDANALCAAVLRLLTNPQLSQTIGIAGYNKLIDQYDWATVADTVLAAYYKLLPQS